MMINSRQNSIAAIAIIVILFASITLNIQISTNRESDDTNFTKVGVIDSGCSENQESFVQDYKTFTTTQYGFFSNDDNIYDNLDHGTKVCDLIHDESPNSILFSARIANFKGELTYQSILAAVQWLVEEKEVDIINLSLGSVPYISDLIDQVFLKYQNDTIFVAASGNGGTSNFNDNGYIEWPAVYPWVIGVGAYSDANSSLPAYYTVGGLSYFGNSVTEYLDNGFASGKQGSSFASPRITGKLAQLLFILRKNGHNPTLNELQGIFSTLSLNWQTNSFDNLQGWGKIDFDLLQSDVYSKLNIFNQATIFHAMNETDVHNRFSDEKWTRSWKFSTIGIEDMDNLNIIFSGSGASIIEHYELELNPWGGLLTVSFDSDNQSGSYLLRVGTEFGNSFEYGFNILSNSVGKVLLDHRTSVNGYGHPYAEFSNFEDFLRTDGFIVHHKLTTDNEFTYSDYDTVILPRFAEAQTVQNLTITRSLSTELLESYENYLSDGGSLIILSDVNDVTHTQQTEEFLSNFYAEYSGINIGSYSSTSTSCCPMLVSNFTTNDITTDIDEFFFLGGEIKSVDGNSTELGWVKVSTNPFDVGFEYLSIGVFGSKGSGEFLILGGTNFITNVYFENQSSNSVKTLIDNFMNV